MSDEPTPEEMLKGSDKLDSMFAASRAMVGLCRTIKMDPRETVACLSTALAIVLRQSGTPFGPDQLEVIRLCIQLELDVPMAERRR